MDDVRSIAPFVGAGVLALVLCIALVYAWVYRGVRRRGSIKDPRPGWGRVTRATAGCGMGGEGGAARRRLMTLALEVHLDGEAPYPLQTKQWVQSTQIHQVGTGAVVAVLVDGGDRQRAWVDVDADPPPGAW